MLYKLKENLQVGLDENERQILDTMTLEEVIAGIKAPLVMAKASVYLYKLDRVELCISTSSNSPTT